MPGGVTNYKNKGTSLAYSYKTPWAPYIANQLKCTYFNNNIAAVSG